MIVKATRSSCIDADLRKRTFVVFGMPRSGTTYLYHTLSKHPQIHVPYRKESHFFSVNYSRGGDWFRSQYAGIKNDQLAADINPVYFLDDRAIKRISRDLPGAKVILCVREPIEFITSLYGNIVTHGQYPPPVEKWVENYAWNLSTIEKLEFSLKQRPIRQVIQELARTFDDDLLVYDYAYFDEYLLEVMARIEAHIGVDAYFDVANLDTTPINATGRRDLWFLNKLIANPKFLETAYPLVPKSLIRFIKLGYDRLIAKPDKSPTPNKPSIISEAELDRLTHTFSADIDFYHSLFANSSIMGGSAIAG